MQVLKVENVYKQYELGQVSTGTMAHDFNRWLHKIRGKEDPYLKITEKNTRDENGGTNFVWALDDISFEVNQGDVVGIIGSNGAGKSTLLKILSKVTSPTKGNIKIKGRIASLLEVGTGFHPDLSGRENIFLNGAILGMTKKEIHAKFDEIVAFSGVDKYIDTPVKRYSSGMYVRLAFSVAAHLEPEILIVDEVLAVGDAEFQKKCLGKMKEVSQQGRTVIFVSHNLVAVKSLCTKGIVMDQGKLVFSGSADEAVENYMNANASKVQPSTAFSSPEDAIGNEFIKIKSVSVQPTNPTITDEFSIHFSFWNFSPGPSIFLAMDLINVYEEVVFGSGFTFETGIDNICEASCIIPADLMNDGLYEINLYFNSVEMRPIFQALNIISFEVSDKDRNYAYFGKVNGSVRPLLKWKVNPK
jgi:lipopolysaccharide transport system ATP-binding protein